MKVGDHTEIVLAFCMKGWWWNMLTTSTLHVWNWQWNTFARHTKLIYFPITLFFIYTFSRINIYTIFRICCSICLYSACLNTFFFLLIIQKRKRAGFVSKGILVANIFVPVKGMVRWFLISGQIKLATSGAQRSSITQKLPTWRMH